MSQYAFLVLEDSFVGEDHVGKLACVQMVLLYNVRHI